MESNMEQSIPKLLPTWHDIALQDTVRKKSLKLFSILNPPDHGGIGVDVSLNSNVYCRVPKYFKSQIRYAANKCALPFFTPKNLDYSIDPCLEHLDREKLEFDKFSIRLTMLKSKTKNREFSKKIKTLQQKIINSSFENHNGEINVPVDGNIVQLANMLPKRYIVPEINDSYGGGTLAVYKNDQQMFLHPVGRNMNKIGITPLQHGSDQHFVPDLTEQSTIKLKVEPILQIEHALDGFCVRQRNSFHLVNMTNMTIHSKTAHKSALYHIAANPYNPLEILSMYEKGTMKLRNMITGETSWSVSHLVYDYPYLLYPTWRCGFGSHPFSVISLNERNLYCFDTRENTDTAKVIFTADNPSFYLNEILVGLKQCNKNSFQHFLTSSHHLVLCDERYPKSPVMFWNHCLRNPPVYLDCTDIDANVSAIVIGTQRNPQVASFLCSHLTEIQPVSLSPPLLMSSPSDCVDSLKLHCHYVDDKITSRFNYPLTGVCIVPYSKENGFTVFQSTSLGDIFYQDFKQSSEASEKTYHVSSGCTLTPPEKILPHLNELLANSEPSKVSEDADGNVAHMYVNIHKVLCPPKEVSSNCMFCRLYATTDDKQLVLSEKCPMCNLNLEESDKLSKALTNDSLIVGPVSEESNFLDCDIEYLSTFDDEYSKRILTVWLESDNVEDSQAADSMNTSSLS